jgi:hypothetical protein
MGRSPFGDGITNVGPAPYAAGDLIREGGKPKISRPGDCDRLSPFTEAMV